MSNSSARGSGLTGESPLDRRLCAELGAELARVRAARGMSVAQISEKLLLSPRQVKALEEVEFSAFHNATFHVNAMRKYAAFAGIDLARVTTIADAIVPTGPPVLLPTPEDDEAGRQGVSLVATIVAAVLVVGAVGYYIIGRRPAVAPTSVSVPTPTPAPPPPPATVAPAVVDGAAVAALSGSEAMAVSTDSPAAASTATATATATAPTAPVASAPASAPAAPVATTVPSAESGFGSVRVLHPTWVYIRDAENVVTEKSLGEGQTIALETQPTYLAVGTPDVQLTIGGKRIELARFVSNGQVRIRAGDFDALAQGVTPITAPTSVR